MIDNNNNNNNTVTAEMWETGDGYMYVYVPIGCAVPTVVRRRKRRCIRYYDRQGKCIAMQYRVRVKRGT